MGGGLLRLWFALSAVALVAVVGAGVFLLSGFQSHGRGMGAAVLAQALLWAVGVAGLNFVLATWFRFLHAPGRLPLLLVPLLLLAAAVAVPRLVRGAREGLRVRGIHRQSREAERLDALDDRALLAEVRAGALERAFRDPEERASRIAMLASPRLHEPLELYGERLELVQLLLQRAGADAAMGALYPLMSGRKDAQADATRELLLAPFLPPPPGADAHRWIDHALAWDPGGRWLSWMAGKELDLDARTGGRTFLATVLDDDDDQQEARVATLLRLGAATGAVDGRGRSAAEVAREAARARLGEGWEARAGDDPAAGRWRRVLALLAAPAR